MKHSVSAVCLCCLAAVLCCSCASKGVKVKQLSKYWDFDAKTRSQEPLKLPEQGAQGFTLLMDAALDLTAKDHSLLRIPGAVTVETKDTGQKTARLEASLTLRQIYGQDEFKTLSIFVPLSALDKPQGKHQLTLQFDGVSWTIYLDGRLHDSNPVIGYPVQAMNSEWQTSQEVDNIRYYTPALKPKRTSSSSTVSNIQYWTPDFHNAWVGDVVTCWFKGRYHLFYLFDRRHHGSKFGTGGHWYEHLSTADFRHWTEHETPIPLRHQWESYGTGTAFEYGGKMYLTYGYHTSRIRHREETTYDMILQTANKFGYTIQLRFEEVPDLYPEGASYAVCANDLDEFVPSNILFHYCENPSVSPDPSGEGLLMYANYMSHGTWSADSLEGEWKALNADFPPGGDCTFPFSMGDYDYIIGGFHNIWYRSRSAGKDAPYHDMTLEGCEPYNGASVPSVTKIPGGRCVMAGWTSNEGWGGNLYICELVQHENGQLGTKWMKEIMPRMGPSVTLADSVTGSLRVDLDKEDCYMLSFEIDSPADSGEVSIAFENRERPDQVLEWALCRDEHRASYTLHPKDSERPRAKTISEGGRPESMKDYAIQGGFEKDGPLSIRMMVYNNSKMSGSLVDTEIDRSRTMLDHQAGFKFDAMTISVKNAKARNLKISKFRQP